MEGLYRHGRRFEHKGFRSHRESEYQFGYFSKIWYRTRSLRKPSCRSSSLCSGLDLRPLIFLPLLPPDSFFRKYASPVNKIWYWNAALNQAQSLWNSYLKTSKFFCVILLKTVLCFLVVSVPLSWVFILSIYLEYLSWVFILNIYLEYLSWVFILSIYLEYLFDNVSAPSRDATYAVSVFSSIPAAFDGRRSR